MTATAQIAWRGPPPAQPYGEGERLAANVRRSQIASTAGLHAAQAARLKEAAWRASACESWRNAAEPLERARGEVKLVAEDADGGIKTFTRPAATLPALIVLLKPDLRLIDVSWRAA